MRIKVVPAPADRALLSDVHEALPLVPGSVEDCCTRIRDRTTVPSRDAAREWLTFAEALGLAAETDRGYHRVRDPPGDEELAAAFAANVFPVQEVLDALANTSEPLDAAGVFTAVREDVPKWERSRHADWESEWQDRIELVLVWCETFGLVEASDGRYVRVSE
jgi:hypothetical protein